jgi:hypothetical protein
MRLLIKLQDSQGVFYKEKLIGNIVDMNKSLEKFEIVIEYVA